MHGELTVPLRENVLMAMGGAQALHGSGEQGKINYTDQVFPGNSTGTGACFLSVHLANKHVLVLLPRG